MDIIIPYNNNNNEIELRYILRGLAERFTPLQKIIIAGPSLPEWIQNVKFLKFVNLELDKFDEIYNKVRLLELLFQTPSISKVFLLWNSKIVLNQLLPSVYYNEHFTDGMITGNDKIIKDTINCLMRKNIIPYNCETILPRFYSKEVIESIYYKYIKLCGGRRYLLFDSLYFGELFKGQKPFDMAYEKILSEYFYKSKDDLSNIFKNKCKYEK